jgi:hypothetical protein
LSFPVPAADPRQPGRVFLLPVIAQCGRRLIARLLRARSRILIGHLNRHSLCVRGSATHRRPPALVAITEGRLGLSDFESGAGVRIPSGAPSKHSASRAIDGGVAPPFGNMRAPRVWGRGCSEQKRPPGTRFADRPERPVSRSYANKPGRTPVALGALRLRPGSAVSCALPVVFVVGHVRAGFGFLR